MIDFDCGGHRLVGTLDEGSASTGLIIVSGGNEIRSGAYAGQAAMAQHFAAKGQPVFRYDRRGVGESEGDNGGFEQSAGDFAAAVFAFRAEVQHMHRLIAFGNCDAATALAFFHAGLPIDGLLLANPWIIEAKSGEPDAPVPPSTADIRARYLARLKNPRSLLDLLSGKIDLRMLAGGLAKAVRKEGPSRLAERLAAALVDAKPPINILIAQRDTTALAFTCAWKSPLFESARAKDEIALSTYDTASHSFADAAARKWLWASIEKMLTSQARPPQTGSLLNENEQIPERCNAMPKIWRWLFRLI